MTLPKPPEVWLRGPLPGIPPLLQPVAHALLQAREEVTALVSGFPDARLWERPAGAASVGFHLQHLTGVLDRLFTYAHGRQLSEGQLAALKAEGAPGAATTAGLLAAFHHEVDKALLELESMADLDLLAPREVGRGRLPSTTLGLLFHAAEHTMRHTGQLLVTVRVLQGAAPGEASGR
ncbi:MAG TPA: DinB family protein [Chitinophagaceae bacterium]